MKVALFHPREKRIKLMTIFPFKLNPILIGLFLSNIYDFALRVEIEECDTCPESNFSRPAH